MKSLRFLLCVLVAVAALGRVHGEEVSLDPCAGIGWNFKIALYLKTAQSLQAEGKEKAVRQLKEWAQSEKYKDQVIILCRMLFEAKKGGQFRAPMLGGPATFGGTEAGDWPLMPIEVFEGIPILVTHGYSLAGKAEGSRGYLGYCLEKCDWHAEQYKTRTAEEIKATLDRWIKARQWPKPLDARGLRFFMEQANEDGKVVHDSF